MPGFAPVRPIVAVIEMSKALATHLLPVIMSGDEHRCQRQHARTHNDSHCFTHRDLHCRTSELSASLQSTNWVPEFMIPAPISNPSYIPETSPRALLPV
ncbi:hypothetical protein R69776_02295 [Paraburkholderia nemoris]|uniref:Uncharacterized protein n=1 Tax=Paraburkholderia nemoris TaxID=2793076 RepID=A0ABM8R7L0_9BURK|nr:hypothetical protein R69776_02295 [Paraburkholderia nemoris]